MINYVSRVTKLSSDVFGKKWALLLAVSKKAIDKPGPGNII